MQLVQCKQVLQNINLSPWHNVLCNLASTKLTFLKLFHRETLSHLLIVYSSRIPSTVNRTTGGIYMNETSQETLFMSIIAQLSPFIWAATIKRFPQVCPANQHPFDRETLSHLGSCLLNTLFWVSDVQWDLCSWQHFPANFDILGLILDKTIEKFLVSHSFCFHILIGFSSSMEQPPSHWPVLVKGRTSFNATSHSTVRL